MRHNYENVTNILIAPTYDGGYDISFDQEDLPEPEKDAPGVEYYRSVGDTLLAFYQNEADSGTVYSWEYEGYEDGRWAVWDTDGSTTMRDSIRTLASFVEPEYVAFPLDR